MMERKKEQLALTNEPKVEPKHSTVKFKPINYFVDITMEPSLLTKTKQLKSQKSQEVGLSKDFEVILIG